MREFIRDFHKRVGEINKYFELVDRIEQLGVFSESSIYFPSDENENYEYKVDSELQKILKSHCYLLLYNLIESSIRNGITAIHEAIQIEQLTYQQLSPKIQKIWLLNDLSRSFLDSSVKRETIANNLQEAIRTVLNDQIISLEPTNIPISGNLDAKTIKALIDLYGFYGNLEISSREIDEILNFIVKIRCDLAHGNLSFSDASNQVVWSTLINDKEKLIVYLTNLLQNIGEYLDRKKYKLQ